MTRKKRSPIWQISKSDLQELVNKSTTFSGVLKHFGLNNIGGNINTLKAKLKSDQIDYAHIKIGRGSNAGRKFYVTKIPLDQILVENSTYSRGHLKGRLIDDNLLVNECAVCKQQPFWDSRVLVMVLDHINGVSNDHRLNNLRLLCPNCNSQTETFCGRKNLNGKQ